MSTIVPAVGRLAYLGRLTLHRSLFTQRFESGCATSRCDATCCTLGVLLDSWERDRILAEANRVRSLMTPGQDHDPGHWFSREEHVDRDFPSGRATHTRAGRDGCVFLDGERRCTLHRAGLKPFFCTVFPLTVADGVLMLESDAEGLTRRACCAAAADGPLTMFETCPAELEHALGPEGVVDLRRLVASRGPDLAPGPPDARAAPAKP
jgi:Fe-S-cluster containining protein